MRQTKIFNHPESFAGWYWAVSCRSGYLLLVIGCDLLIDVWRLTVGDRSGIFRGTKFRQIAAIAHRFSSLTDSPSVID